LLDGSTKKFLLDNLLDDQLKGLLDRIFFYPLQNVFKAPFNLVIEPTVPIKSSRNT